MRRVEQVAAIENRSIPQFLAELVQIQNPVVLPFGHHYQSVCTFQSILLALHQLQVITLAIMMPDSFDRLRVVGLNPGTGCPECFKQGMAGCFANIVGIGFEGQPPDSEDLAPEFAVIMSVDIFKQTVLLAAIDLFDSIEQRCLHPVLAGCADQRLQVLG